MNHITPRIQAFLDDELAPTDAQHVRAHVETCEACRRELEAHRRLNARLAGADQVPTAASIWPDLSRRLSGHRQYRWTWAHRSLAIAATLSGILLGWRVGAPGPADPTGSVVATAEAGYLESSLPSLDHLWLQIEDTNGDDGS